jgi:hypothetical protein
MCTERQNDSGGQDEETQEGDDLEEDGEGEVYEGEEDIA